MATCLRGCLTARESKCKAINVNKALMVCELLSATAIDEASSMEESPGWEYYGPKKEKTVCDFA